MRPGDDLSETSCTNPSCLALRTSRRKGCTVQVLIIASISTQTRRGFADATVILDGIIIISRTALGRDQILPLETAEKKGDGIMIHPLHLSTEITYIS